MTYNKVLKVVAIVIVRFGLVWASNHNHVSVSEHEVERFKESFDENNATMSLILLEMQRKLKKQHLLSNSRQLTTKHERYIVKYKNSFGRQTAINVAKTIYHDFHVDGYVAIDLSPTAMELLEMDMNIESIQIDSVWTEDGVLEYIVDPAKMDEFFMNTTTMTTLINSTNAGRTLQTKEQIPYGISMVQAASVPYGSTKAMVCLVDTGVTYWHTDLPQNLMTGASRKSSTTGQTLNWSVDKRGHGTHISGIVSAKANNKYGVRGMGNIPLYITRGLNDDGSARESDIREAMEQCEKAGAKVVSLSLSGSSISNLMKTVLDRLYSKNILVVAAAGNDGKRVGNFPASYANVVSVGAVQQDESVWKNSNYGPWVEVTAPGVSILSTGTDTKGQYTFVSYSGTSMATPHVAGAAALLMSNFPKCTATQIRYALAKTAKDKGSRGCDDYYGYGIIQVKAAYDFLTRNTCTNAGWGKTVGSGMCSLGRRLGQQ